MNAGGGGSSPYSVTHHTSSAVKSAAERAWGGPLELVPLASIARASGVCSETARRKLAAAEVRPVGLLVGGERQNPVQLFLRHDRARLVKLIQTPAVIV